VTTDATNILDLKLCGTGSPLTVLAATTNSGIHFWDASAGMRFIQFVPMDGGCRGIAYLPSTSSTSAVRVVTGSFTSGAVYVLHVTASSAKVEQTLSPSNHVASMQSMASDSRLSLVATLDSSGKLVFWDASGASWVPQASIAVQDDAITCMAYIPGARLLAAGFLSGMIRVYNQDSSSAEVAFETSAHVRGVTGLDVWPSPRMLVTCSEDSIVHVFGVSEGAAGSKVHVAAVGHLQLQDCILTGVCFSHAGAVCTTSYDSLLMQVLALE
jgi:WD40 repeat protein